jgi:hypothetical protein
MIAIKAKDQKTKSGRQETATCVSITPVFEAVAYALHYAALLSA